jgi:hypothetical protein
MVKRLFTKQKSCGFDSRLLHCERLWCNDSIASYNTGGSGFNSLGACFTGWVILENQLDSKSSAFVLWSSILPLPAFTGEV